MRSSSVFVVAVPVAVAAVAALVAQVALRKKRRLVVQPVRTVSVDEVDSERLQQWFREGVAVKVVGACASKVDVLYEDKAFQLLFPSRVLRSTNPYYLPHSQVLAVADRIAGEPDNAANACLFDLDLTSPPTVAQRGEWYKRNDECYGMANLTDVPESTRAALSGNSALWRHLTAWKRCMEYLWIGASPGSFHYDEHDNVLFQLRGRKRVYVVPAAHAHEFSLRSLLRDCLPNHCRHHSAALVNHSATTSAGFANAATSTTPCFVADLGPGDAVLLPAGALHGPVGSPDSVSVNTFLLDGPPPREKWLLTRVVIANFLSAWLRRAAVHHSFDTATLTSSGPVYAAS